MNKYAELFKAGVFLKENRLLVDLLRVEPSLRSARKALWKWLDHTQFKQYNEESRLHPLELVVVRDCIRALQLMATYRKEKRSNFSLVKALWDVACGRKRPELSTAFWAEMINLCRGARGRSNIYQRFQKQKADLPEGREAAIERSNELDELWEQAYRRTERYPHGLQPEVINRRHANRSRILEVLGASIDQWNDWHWQLQNVAKELHQVERLVSLSDEERECIRHSLRDRTAFRCNPLLHEPNGQQP